MRVATAGARNTLIGARAAFGLAAILTPRLILRSLGLRPEDNADYAYLLRLWGTREAFVAAMSAGVGGNSTTALAALRLGMAVDTVDLGSLWLAHRNGRTPPAAVAFLALAGAAAVGLGYLAAAEAHNHLAEPPRP